MTAPVLHLPGSAPGPLTSLAQPAASTVPAFVRADEVELAERLLADLRSRGELTWDQGEFWQYQPRTGIWQVVPFNQVVKTLASYAGTPVATPTPKLLRLSHGTITGAIKIASSLVAADTVRPRFEDAPRGVGFRNGFVVVDAGLLRIQPYTPQLMARHCYDFDFDPNASHPLLDKYFGEVFGDTDPVDAAERVQLLAEFTGTAMIGAATKYQRCLMNYGEGENSKSTCLEILRSAFPPGATTTLPPQDWGARFRTCGLVGKLVNMVDEIPEAELVANAVFKSIVSGEPQIGEQKNRQPFTFRPIAGHIFSANSLPATRDHSSGFWRRFMVVPFTRKMSQTGALRRNVAGDIIRAELPGIVAWALAGAARVQLAGDYTHCRASDVVLHQWRQDSDPVARFVSEECVVDTATSTGAKVLYQAFDDWSSKNGFSRMTSTRFWRRLNHLGHASQHTRVGNVYLLRFRGPVHV